MNEKEGDEEMLAALGDGDDGGGGGGSAAPFEEKARTTLRAPFSSRRVRSRREEGEGGGHSFPLGRTAGCRVAIAGLQGYPRLLFRKPCPEAEGGPRAPHALRYLLWQVRVTKMPETINHSFGEMRPYQIAGLNWLANLYQNGAGPR